MSGKGKDPAFLFYPADFLIGTMDMSDADVGRYIRLLCRQFEKGHLPSLGDASDAVAEKFTLDEEGKWYNRRLEAEKVKRQNFTASRRENGSKGGRPKNDKKTYEEPTENHMDINKNHMQTKCEPSENLPENENENKDKDINKKTKGRNEIAEERLEQIREEIRSKPWTISSPSSSASD